MLSFLGLITLDRSAITVLIGGVVVLALQEQEKKSEMQANGGL